MPEFDSYYLDFLRERIHRAPPITTMAKITQNSTISSRTASEANSSNILNQEQLLIGQLKRRFLRRNDVKTVHILKSDIYSSEQQAFNKMSTYMCRSRKGERRRLLSSFFSSKKHAVTRQVLCRFSCKSWR
jgi:hypothetical protein